MSLIVYSSTYGTTKKYAVLLSEMTGIRAVNIKEFKYASDIEKIVYLAPVYANKVQDLKEFLSVVEVTNDMDLILGVVCANDLEDAEHVKNVETSVGEVIPEDFYNTKLHLLGGGYTYSKLSKTHKFMLFVLHTILKRKNPDKLTANEKSYIEHYKKDINRFDAKYLEPIIEAIEN